MSDQSQMLEQLPLTDRLALNRTLLANERTLLAYIRTAIMVAVSGITLIKLFPEELAAQVPGWVLMGLSLIVAAFGTFRFFHVSRELQEVQQPSHITDTQRGE